MHHFGLIICKPKIDRASPTYTAASLEQVLSLSESTEETCCRHNNHNIWLIMIMIYLSSKLENGLKWIKMENHGKSKTSETTNQNQPTSTNNRESLVQRGCTASTEPSMHLGETGSSVGVGDSLATGSPCWSNAWGSTPQTSFNPPRFWGVNKFDPIILNVIMSNPFLPQGRRML